jgi:GNAT superfamily N-acetyltransferase
MNVAKTIVDKLLEGWHDWARLEAWTNGRSFQFFKNGLLIGQILAIYERRYAEGKLPAGYLMGMGVHHALHGTGIGRAMMAFVLDNVRFEDIILDAAEPQFYRQLGFRPIDPQQKSRMILNKRDFTGSTLKFTPISEEEADTYEKTGHEKGHKLNYFKYRSPQKIAHARSQSRFE